MLVLLEMEEKVLQKKGVRADEELCIFILCFEAKAAGL